MRVKEILPPANRAGNSRTETCKMPQDPAMIKFLTANKSRLVEGPFCGSLKFNYPKSDDEQIALLASAITDAPDIVKMNEWFGSGGAAGRPILVSQKVKDIFDNMQWRGLWFSAIQLVED